MSINTASHASSTPHDPSLRYDLWANKRLTSWLMTIDRHILYEKRGSSFGTIDLTLQHILMAQIYWHALIARGEINEFNAPVK
ncbi:hypothetical protein KK062_11480 [Fulvivirgaceae bacterium PWU5]|uniref:Uncharacterized protein n=1 Tax=Dawidia cretensis TaxID=2782350 RepID=A0AAP2DYM9_9BACT|nr:hypothetical protein [Dawidia cretensis]